jgi:hypothetical protein
MNRNKIIAAAIAAAAAGVALAGCGAGGSLATGQSAPLPTASTAPAPSASAPPATPTVSVLTPGHSATFSVRPYSGGPATRLTWTMGPRVVTGTRDSLGQPEQPGYEDVGFQVTIRNDGPAPTGVSPGYGSSLTWTGRDGRSDDTLASTAAKLGPSDLGLTGTDITLQPSLAPGGYVSGYLIWPVPTAPGYVTLLSGSVDGLSTYPVLRIVYGVPAAVPQQAAPAKTQPPAAAAPQLTSGVAVVLQFYTDLSNHDYQAAWNLGGSNVSGGVGYDSWAAGYATTASISVTGYGTYSDGTVWTHISAVQDDGSVRTYDGTYSVSGGVIVSAQMSRTS